MGNELEALLFSIRDGAATPEMVERARLLVQGDDRLPAELREVVDFTDDPEGDAVGLLAVLGADSLFGDVLREGIAAELAETEPSAPSGNREAIELDEVWELNELFVEAVHTEAGQVELVGAVLTTVGIETPELPIADAVHAEAGRVELAADVVRTAGFEAPIVPVAEALHAEAGQVELVGAVFAALGLNDAEVPVAEAVHGEAGEVQVDAQVAAMVEGSWVSAMVDGELAPQLRQEAVRRLRDEPESGTLMTAFASLGTDLRAAIHDEAGDVGYVWGGVAEAVGIQPEVVPGWDSAAFVEAVRDEAGEVDVTDAVMGRVIRRMPQAVVEIEPMPEAANDRRWSGLLMAMVAVAVLLVVVPTAWNNNVSPSEPTVSAAQFAAADEIVIENLDYGEHSNVYEVMGDDGALILWVDEGSVQ